MWATLSITSSTLKLCVPRRGREATEYTSAQGDVGEGRDGAGETSSLPLACLQLPPACSRHGSLRRLTHPEPEDPSLLPCRIHFALKEEDVWIHRGGKQKTGVEGKIFLITTEIGERGTWTREGGDAVSKKAIKSTRGVGIRDQTCKANRLSGLRQDTVNPSASFSFSQAQAVLQLINLAGCLEIYPWET